MKSYICCEKFTADMCADYFMFMCKKLLSAHGNGGCVKLLCGHTKA